MITTTQVIAQWYPPELELLQQKHGAQAAEQSQSSEARDVSYERRFKSQGQQCEDLERRAVKLVENWIK